ncbi:MAG: redox-regulated ATPase YchF [Bacteroidetes bacterium CG2_30_33_31]|nr:MAG: redox-regulated ATPase YchF [Bacteroidetes bacterium CG2_30_33_31]
MALNCGIIGLTNSGKTTIFNCMSKSKGEITSYAFSTNKSNIGIVDVPDPRLDLLTKLVPAKRVIHATVELVDIPGLTKGSSQGEGIGNQFLGDIRNSNALIYVLRCFEDELLPHVEGSIDPVRDIELLEFELQVKDLELVERKLERQKKLLKVGDKSAKFNVDTLLRFKENLENFESLRNVEATEDERLVVRDLQLLTEKPVLYVCNVDEKSAINGNLFSAEVKKSVGDAEVIIIAGALEADIAGLDDEEDRKAFLEDSGLAEPGVDKLIRAAYHILNLRTFFTVGDKENKAWTIIDGYSAPQAAGVIHSDLERGFIRAEVIKYQDFIKLGSENAVKEAGKFHVEGKTYIVEDGDLLNIRFNV